MSCGSPTKLQLEDRGWLDRPVTLIPRLGDTDVWQLINTFPIHCHILKHGENDMMRPFQVLG